MDEIVGGLLSDGVLLPVEVGAGSEVAVQLDDGPTPHKSHVVRVQRWDGRNVRQRAGAEGTGID